jgi:hypothetical protein
MKEDDTRKGGSIVPYLYLVQFVRLDKGFKAFSYIPSLLDFYIAYFKVVPPGNPPLFYSNLLVFLKISLLLSLLVLGLISKGWQATPIFSKKQRIEHTSASAKAVAR